MQGYCVIGVLKKSNQELIIHRLKFNSIHSINFNTPKEFNWTDKKIAKIFLSEVACNKLFNKIKESEFEKLFENLYIKQIELTEEKIIKIV